MLNRRRTEAPAEQICRQKPLAVLVRAEGEREDNVDLETATAVFREGRSPIDGSSRGEWVSVSDANYPRGYQISQLHTRNPELQQLIDLSARPRGRIDHRRSHL